jgi:hypothetical protein
MNREPFFGPNAKPFFVQAAVGIVVLVALNRWVRPILEPWADAVARFIVSIF